MGSQGVVLQMNTGFVYGMGVVRVVVAWLALVGVASIANAQTTYSGITFQDGDASFADAVIDYSPGVFPSSSPLCQTASNALGPPDRSFVSCGGYVSLGQGGSLTLSVVNPALRASGTTQPDLHIFEIGSAVELFQVEISQDGVAWITIGELSGQPSSVDIDAHPDVDAGDEFGFVRLTDLSNTNNGADIDAVGVNPEYLPPTSDAGNDQSVVSEQKVTLDGSGSASSVSGVLITYAWSQASGPSVSLSDATSVAPTFTAPQISIGGAAQQITFDLVVTDDLGQVSEKDTVTITANAPNDTPPTADAGPDQSVVSGSVVTLDGSGSSDPDPGDTLTYQWSQLSGPSVSLNSATAVHPDFTAPNLLVTDDPVSLEFGLVVTDSYGESSSPSQVVVVVAPPGDVAPTADAGADQSVSAGTAVTLDGANSYDPDPGDSITYRWRQLGGSEVTLSDQASVQPTFSAPDLLVTDDPLALVFELVVTDSLGESSSPDQVTIAVSPPGDAPPTADAGVNQAVASGASVTLDGSNSKDPDPGDSMSYRWSQISGTTVSLGDATSVKPSFVAPSLLVTDDPMTLVFELVVTDQPGQSSIPDQVAITVAPPGDTPPTAVVRAPSTVMQGARVVFDGSDSFDPDPGDQITYRWRQISGPSVTLSDATASQVQFMAPKLSFGEPSASLVFELVVFDLLDRQSQPQRFILTTTPPSQPQALPVPSASIISLLVLSLSVWLMSVWPVQRRARWGAPIRSDKG